MKSQPFILLILGLILLAGLTLHLISKPHRAEKEKRLTTHHEASSPKHSTETLETSPVTSKSPKNTHPSPKPLASKKGLPYCSSCQSYHPKISAHLFKNPTVKKLLSRNSDRLTHQTLADGTEFFDLNNTFSHVTVAETNPDGTVSIHCSTSANELSHSILTTPVTHQATK
ncbi:MAG: hypothetical protein ACSHX0_14225 [Akkermansiaceae bacterium]